VTSTIVTDGNGRWVEYAGGYTDMLAQRPAASRDSQARNIKRCRPTKQTIELPAGLPRRMTCNDPDTGPDRG